MGFSATMMAALRHRRLCTPESIVGGGSDASAWVNTYSSTGEGASIFGGAEPSIYIKDLSTPANDVNVTRSSDRDAFESVFDYTAPSAKWGMLSTGLMGWFAHNLWTQSVGLTHADWSSFEITVSGDSLIPSTNSVQHGLFHNTTTVQDGALYEVEVEAKANGYDIIWFNGLTGSASNDIAFVDLSDGTEGTVQSNADVTITALADGWYRIVYRQTVGISGTSYYMGVYVAETDNQTGGWAGDGTSGVLLRNPVLRRQGSDTTYLPTTDAARYSLPFEWDISTETYRLKVESEATNIVLDSNGTWTDSAHVGVTTGQTSPSGETDATLLYAKSTTGQHTQGFTVTAAATNYTISFEAKAGGYNFAWVNTLVGGVINDLIWFDLASGEVGTSQSNATGKILPLGNGWYRCVVSYTGNWTAGSATFTIGIADADNNTSFTGDDASGLIVRHVQMEAGSEATSQIPTAGSTVTRAGDVISKPTSEMPFSTTAGTLFSEYVSPPAFSFIAEIFTDNANRFQYYANNSADRPQTTIWDGGVVQTDMNHGASPQFTPGDTVKYASAYAEDDFAAVYDGGLVGTDASGTIPTVAALYIGSGGAGGSQLNNHIKSLGYIPERVSNANLQTMTEAA